GQAAAEQPRDVVGERVVAPRDVRREGHGPAVGGDEAGRGEAHRTHLVLARELAHGIGDGRVDARRVVRLGGARDLGEDLAGLVDNPHSDLGAADVDACRQHAHFLLPSPSQHRVSFPNPYQSQWSLHMGTASATPYAANLAALANAAWARDADQVVMKYPDANDDWI